MNNLNECIANEKKRYLEFIESNKDKRILIYGAGKQAKMLYEFLKSIGARIDGFCVTDEQHNKKEQSGLKVYQVNKLQFKSEDIAFLIGVRSQLNEEIIKTLRDNGFYTYLKASDYIRYLGVYGYNFYTNPMLEITTQIGCSVNCKYCPQKVLLHSYFKTGDEARSLSLQNFTKCVDRLPKNTLIEFAGFTEAFLNKECIDMIKYAVNEGFKVNLFTTLVGVDDDILNQLIDIQFEEFVLHLPDQEGYSVIPMDDKYMGYVKKLLNAKKKNGEDFIDYACSQGKIPDKLESIIANKIRLYIVLNDRAGNLSDEKLYCKKNIGGKIRCELSEDINHNVLLPDGRVVLCSNDWGMKHVLGNLLEQSYEEIINGKEAEKVRTDLKNECGKLSLCRNCFQAISY